MDWERKGGKRKERKINIKREGNEMRKRESKKERDRERTDWLKNKRRKEKDDSEGEQ